MMGSQITAHQHYVPQCLLKHFGQEGKRAAKINIFDLSSSSIRYNQSVKNVFSQNYFYDKDNMAESFLAENVERPASKYIEQLVNHDIEPIINGNRSLVRFVATLLYRTVEAREGALDFINQHFGQIVSELSRLNDLKIENPFDWKIAPKDDDGMRAFTATIALQGVVDSVILEDLKFHLVVNETDTEFFISDHPVFKYNWFYRELTDPRIASLTATGLQLFLPLSSQIYLCLYDPKIYKYGTRDSFLTLIDNIEDVSILNSFQAMNAVSFIGFKSKKTELVIKQSVNNFSNVKVHLFDSCIIETRENLNGNMKSTHIVFTKQAKISKMPSFVKIWKKAKLKSGVFTERNPELSAAPELYKRAERERFQ